jgi:hypothetical protein
VIAGACSGPRAFDAAAVEERCRESEAVAAIHLLNAEFIRGFAESDVTWYREHLRDDFVCTLVDGQRIDKDEFLRLASHAAKAGRITSDEVDVRPLGDVALAQGVMHRLVGETTVLTRYTVVWRSWGERWQAVAAQFTRVARDASGRNID